MFGDANARWSKRSQRHVNLFAPPPMHNTINDLSSVIIGAAIEVHRALGPGLLESAYQQCLARELSLRNIPFQQQKSLPVHYKGTQLDCGYRLDFLVADIVVVEVKAIDALLPIHQAQLLSYLKLGGWKLGLLINFGSYKFEIRKFVWTERPPPKQDLSYR